MKNIFYILFTICVTFTIKAQTLKDMPNLGPFCPTTKDGHLIESDREFGSGSGVNNSVLITFNRTADDIIIVTVSLDMKEVRYQGDKSKRTMVYAEWTQQFYKASQGEIVEEIQTPSGSYKFGSTLQISGWSKKAGPEFGFCNDGDAHEFSRDGITVNLIADTGGIDVSDDDDCNCDSRINWISFENSWKIKVAKKRDVEYTCKLTNQRFNQVLDGSASTPQRAQLWENLGNKNDYVRGAENQKWNIIDYGDGVFKIKNRHSGRVLDASASQKGKVQLWEDLGVLSTYVENANNQKWRFSEYGDGMIRIENAHYRNMYLHASENRNEGLILSTYSPSESKNNKWKKECEKVVIQ